MAGPTAGLRVGLSRPSLGAGDQERVKDGHRSTVGAGCHTVPPGWDRERIRGREGPDRPSSVGEARESGPRIVGICPDRPRRVPLVPESRYRTQPFALLGSQFVTHCLDGLDK